MRAISAAPPPTDDEAFEVLWAGDASPAIASLRALGVRISCVSAEECAKQVAARAPDMVVLSDSVGEQATSIIRELRDSRAEALPPVIVISPGATPVAAHQRRTGVIARYGSELPCEVVASRIHEQLRQLATHRGSLELALAWEEIDGWLNTAVREGSCGLLVTSEPAGAIALGHDGHVAPAPSQLRKPHASHSADPKPVRFVELPPSRLLVVHGSAQEEDKVVERNLGSARVLLIHPDSARRDALQQALERAGADAEALSCAPSDIARVPSLAPTLIVTSASVLALPAAVSLWEDARLASASWLVLDDATNPMRTPASVVDSASLLVAQKDALQRRMAEGEPVLGRIESFGTTGWLKEVGRCQRAVTLLLKGAKGRAEVSLTSGKINSARFVSSAGGPPLEGRPALESMLAMSFGRVFIGPHERVLALETSLRAELPPPPVRPVEARDPTPEPQRPVPAPPQLDPEVPPNRVPALLAGGPARFDSLPAPELPTPRGTRRGALIGVASLAAAGLVLAFVRAESPPSKPGDATELQPLKSSSEIVRAEPAQAQSPVPQQIEVHAQQEADEVENTRATEQSVSTPIRKGTEASAWLERAKEALADARYTEAEQLLNDVLARHPNDFGGRYHMALTLVKMRRFQEAHTQLTRAIELNAESPHAWLLEGDIFAQEGFRPQAIRAWTRCLEVRPEFPACEERLSRWSMRANSAVNKTTR